MKDLIKKLVEVSGPSGYEGAIRQVVRAEIEKLVDEVRVDNLGNLIAVKNPTPGLAGSGMKVMLAAHMDEIGLIVTHIDERGFARFTTIGGVRPQTLPGSRARFLNGSMGVIGTERNDDVRDAPGFEQMYIDFGVSTSQGCPVQVGDVAAFERPYAELGGRVVAKSLDDRIGVAVLIEALRALASTPHQLFFVFSVQEEVGIRGATTAAFGIDPDLGLAVDVTGTGDTPRTRKMAVALGKGPAIKVRDSRMLADPRVVSWMVDTAQAAGIPYQMEVLELGSTDAAAIQLVRAGVPAGCLSIPCRYIHSPSEMVDYGDVQQAVTLLARLLSQPIALEK